MHRFGKLLGIILIFGIVFFIICDEKGYKIGLKDNHIVFNKTEKKSELLVEEDPFKEVVYKNSDRIHINYEFENPKTLRKADGIDTEYLAKIEEEKRLEQERIEEEKRLEKERLEEEKLREQERAKKLALKDEDTISSVFQGRETQDNTGTTKPEIASKPEVKQNTGTAKPEVKQNTGTAKPEVKQNTGTAKPEVKQNTGTAKPEVKQNTGTTKPEVKQNTGTVKPEVKQNTGTAKPEVKQNTGTAKPEVKQNTGTVKPEVKQNTGTAKPEVKQNTGTAKPEVKQNTGTVKLEVKQNTGTVKPEVKQNTGTAKPEVKQNTGTAKPEVKQNTGTAKPEVKQNTGTAKPEVKQNTGTAKPEEVKTIVYYPVKKYEHNKNILDLSIGAEPKKYKVEKYQRNELALNLCEGKVSEPKILYKNSNRIKLYTGFENPRNMRSSAGIDEESLAKKENKKPTSWDNSDTISSALQNKPNTNENITNTGDSGIEIGVSEIEEDINTGVNDVIESGNIVETGIIILGTDEENGKEPEVVLVKVDKYQHNKHSLDLYEGKIPEVILVKVDKYQHNKHSLDLYEGKIPEPTLLQVDKFEHEDHTLDLNEGKEPEIVLVKVDKYQHNKHNLDLNEGKIPEVVLVKVDKYQHTKYNLELYEGKAVEHNFIVDNTTENIEPTENGLSDSLMDSLLEDEEINIDTLESENDEFLQKVFEKTRDRDVMNLIVETYLNEYQFVKAKKFIEELPEMYLEELKPSLHLRVVFNSFPLSSKNINENLNLILQDYINRGLIMDEDKNRYLGVLALMDRNYDKFFEIAAQFTSEKNKAFASKLQGYKDQISKQMGMPQYYFDTLVSLELFNQGLFQPSKVLALYSLQQNANYILPHQVLAYANFLTNSRDTSVEYFKKLVDLDPNNAEKYRFLMGVASYRDEKYEQSVVMLSMIKDEKLRLDTQRYLINDYLKLDQKNKLISNRNKMLGYENLVASDFYTYFYETFFRPYSQGEEFQLYSLDTELANKMLRVCSMTLQDEEKAVCTYGTIGRNIAMGQFDGMEQYLLNLVAEYPQGYLYQALGEYYVKQGELDKAKAYLLKAVSLTQKRTELSQIKKLLQQTI